MAVAGPVADVQEAVERFPRPVEEEMMLHLFDAADAYRRAMDEAIALARKHRRVVCTLLDEDGYVAEEFCQWDDEEPSYYY